MLVTAHRGKTNMAGKQSQFTVRNTEMDFSANVSTLPEKCLPINWKWKKNQIDSS